MQSGNEGATAQRVVVGVDGSAGSRAALRFAAHEANRRHLGVRVVKAQSTEPDATSGAVEAEGISDLLRLMTAPATALLEEVGPPLRLPCADRRLKQMVREELGSVPPVPVDTECWEGRPGRVLADLSADAALVVVGARGQGGFGGMRLGSVAQQVAHRAVCPVVVVHRTWRRGPVNELGVGKVVAGLNLGSGLSVQAGAVLGFAADEARFRADPLEVIAVRELAGSRWRHKAKTAEPMPTGLVDAITEAVAAAVDTTGVQVQVSVRTGNPAEELVAASRDAVLVVIGSGPDPHAGLEPGSVRQQVVEYAACPVALLKEPPR